MRYEILVQTWKTVEYWKLYQQVSELSEIIYQVNIMDPVSLSFTQSTRTIESK